MHDSVRSLQQAADNAGLSVAALLEAAGNAGTSSVAGMLLRALALDRRQPRDRVLTIKEAAAAIGVSRATLLRRIALGTGPAVAQLSSKRIGIRESCLWAWVEQCEKRREDERAA